MYEVEIKSLLVNKEQADRLLDAMSKSDTHTKEKARSSQLNHYFLLGDLQKLSQTFQSRLSTDDLVNLKNIIENGKQHSVRTRKENDRVILVVKAVADTTNSIHGTARIEFETTFHDLNIHELDQLLLDANFPYQAKWSRDRVEYHYKDYTVAIDKNAGYGYLAEFEKIVEDKELLELTKQQIRDEIRTLGFDELPQDRLDRMFKHYNQHWNEYYGTDKVFTIE